MTFAADSTGWWVGMSLGFAAVAVLVLLVSMMLRLAAQIADQIRFAGEALEVARERTDSLHEATTINASANAILEGARGARQLLTR